ASAARPAISFREARASFRRVLFAFPTFLEATAPSRLAVALPLSNSRTSQRVPAKTPERAVSCVLDEARKLWRERQRYVGSLANETLSAGASDHSQFLESPSVDAVLLHLEVQGLVVGSEKARRLALVAPGDLEDLADRLPLGVSCRRLGDLLQREAERRGLSSARGHGGRLDTKEREVFWLNHIRSEEDGPTDDVPKLPHVARPGVVQKDLRRRF